MYVRKLIANTLPTHHRRVTDTSPTRDMYSILSIGGEQRVGRLSGRQSGNSRPTVGRPTRWCDRIRYHSPNRGLLFFQLGRRMAEFPVEPTMSKTLIASEKYVQCNDIIVVLLLVVLLLF